MSYDFQLFPNRPGVEPNEAYETWQQEQEELPCENPTQSSTLDAERQRTIRDLLVNLNPEFEQAIQTDGAGIDYIELSDPGSGVQVSLFSDCAGITIPYWHAPKDYTQLFKAIWTCLELLQTNGNFLTFDRQVGRVISLKEDFELVVSCYSQCMKQTEEIFRTKRH